MAKKRGRPPGDPAKTLSEMVPIRMTKAERDGFERAADKSDQTLSEWVRSSLSEAVKRAQKGR